MRVSPCPPAGPSRRPWTRRPRVEPIHGDVEKHRAVQRCQSDPTPAKSLRLQGQ